MALKSIFKNNKVAHEGEVEQVQGSKGGKGGKGDKSVKLGDVAKTVMKKPATQFAPETEDKNSTAGKKALRGMKNVQQKIKSDRRLQAVRTA